MAHFLGTDILRPPLTLAGSDWTACRPAQPSRVSPGSLPCLPLHIYSNMLSLARRSAFALRKYCTATSARTTPGAFPFLPVNALGAKLGRNKGITEIRGPYYFPVTRTYLDELLSDWGEYVDGIKFAGGSFSLMPEARLRDLIEVAHKHGALGLRLIYRTASIADAFFFCPDCYVSTGGYIERVLAASAGNKDVLTRYLRKCKDLGFDVLELSSGFLSIPTDDWAALVELTASHGLKPKPEVGIQ